MSELQLWLLGIGILIVIGVVAFNKWQEIQLKRRTERTFGPSHSDVLMDAPPSSVPREKAPKGRLQDTPADALSPTASMPNAEPVEHHLGLAPAEEPVAARGPILDARVDFTATITFSEPQNGEALLGLCDDVASASAKPVHWEGLRGNAWVELSPSENYAVARAGLQLVDRAGRATDDDLVAFCGAMQTVSATTVGEVDFPSRSEALKIAESLDNFCADVDIQVGLNVVKPNGGAIAGAQVRSALEAAGGEAKPDGSFAVRVADGTELCSVISIDSRGFTAAELAQGVTGGLTVVMDVPRVREEGASFSAYSDFAQRLAQALGGVLQDDNRQPVSAPALQAIATQVAAVRERMREYDLPAGSALALRLFA